MFSKMVSSTLALFIVLVYSASAQQSRSVHPIDQAIDQVLARGKFEMEPRIDKVASFGDEAVPYLVARYPDIDAADRSKIVSCLCRIGTDKSLGFVRDMMRKRADRQAVETAIRDYPVRREEEILPLLIDLLPSQDYRFYTDERLREMILRRPARAGALVAALDHSNERDPRFVALTEVLASVSGYPRGVVWIPFEGTRAPFWPIWWSDNKNKDVFGWLVEAAHTPKVARQELVLQQMGHLKDRRAIPYFVSGLHSQSERVQYWAVVGLMNLEKDGGQSGYAWEKFEQEKESILAEMKRKYAAAADPAASLPTTAPAEP